MSSSAILPIVDTPRFHDAAHIDSLLIKPASALCNLDCAYCFYLDRETDPYKEINARRMPLETLERMVRTYLAYSYPNATFAFQGGEPTLAGLPFFRALVEYQLRYGQRGHNISNALQTNAVLINEDWCKLFAEYNFLLGVSLDGPEKIHDIYRVNKGGRGSYRQVMDAIALLKKHKVEFNILCVLTQMNVNKPKDLYRFFKSLGVDNVQYIPLAEFGPNGAPLPYTIDADQYGRFLCETFDLWWPDRRKMRIRCFDNLAEAVAGMKPGSCTLHDSCDSYVVVEYNGDVYPCDFFVEDDWKLGNVNQDSWDDIARRAVRRQFAKKKSVPHAACEACEWKHLCYRGCPKFRHGPAGRFEDLDYFCGAYKMLFAKAVTPLEREVQRLYGGDGRPN